MSDKVRILLVRHGQSEGNESPELYKEKGDSNVGLTDKGWRQALGTGKFLGRYYQEIDLPTWPMIHVSTHERTLQTLSGILAGMRTFFQGEPAIYPQPFLVEKFFGAASVLAFPDEEIPESIVNAISVLSKKVYANDPFTAKHLFGESTKDTMIAAKLLMEGTIRRDIEQGKRDLLIVCHGAVIQAILMSWMHAMPRDKDKIGNPGNGDVIEISGFPKDWSFKRIWDGQKGERVDENLCAKVERFTASDLPPIPDFLKNKL